MATHRWVVGLLFTVLSFGAAAADADFAWPNLTDFLSRLIKRVGSPVKVYKLKIDSHGEVDLWIQDQDRRDLIDSYEYDHGKINGPIPVKFDHYPTVDALDYHVIELTTIDFPRLPAMLDSAREKLNLPDGRLSSIELERGDSRGKHHQTNIPIWTLWLDAARHDGHVSFDLQGRVLHVDKN
jgi:hypothetical protein